MIASSFKSALVQLDGSLATMPPPVPGGFWSAQCISPPRLVGTKYIWVSDELLDVTTGAQVLTDHAPGNAITSDRLITSESHRFMSFALPP